MFLKINLNLLYLFMYTLHLNYKYTKLVPCNEDDEYNDFGRCKSRL